MAEIIREDDDPVGVAFRGRSLDIANASDDFVLAECSIDDLDGEVAGDWPEELTLRIHSENGFGTFFFHELHVSSDKGDVILDFVCHTPNKYWEGHYGLAAFIQALRNQVEYADNLEVTHFETEDDWKAITLRRRLASGDPLHHPSKLQPTASKRSCGTRRLPLAALSGSPNTTRTKTFSAGRF